MATHKAKTHNYYQPQGVTIHTRQIGRHNWAWRVCDFFYVEIDRGDGCRTKREARGKARTVKETYLASVVVVPLHLTVRNPARKKH